MSNSKTCPQADRLYHIVISEKLANPKKLIADEIHRYNQSK